ncbi:acyl-CoA dehydrogenase [Microbacterium deminutum]|uniref:Acyl-CoA dehydrogenase n=2 Tax=Microbacterium deminutum TaxID=344164 RepID=A0ABN2QHA4_9MICO
MSAVSLTADGHDSPLVTETLASASRMPQLGADVAATLDWCVDVGRRAPVAGEGDTRLLWELLAAIARVSVSAARMLEPHLDALGILHQAGCDFADGCDPWGVGSVGAGEGSSWGVFAAESAGTRLEAVRTDAGWVLRGTKPWCSLAHELSHALVTGFVDDTRRQLFAVDLRGAGVQPHRGEWFARGLPHVVSSPVDFHDAPAAPVGDVGWYLSRPGFAWGGMSVAACWWGAAQGVADALVEPARGERADQLALVHLGRADAALWAARSVLAEAADLVDAGVPPGLDQRLLAERVRAAVVDAATLTLAEADAALGPAPLVSDPGHARRVSDLHLYLRQHHGLRDAARIGRLRISAGS